MSFEDEFAEITFEGESFSPAAIVCDTRDGELAIVVEQQGDDLRVRWFSDPLAIHACKADDFALVEPQRLACAGIVLDTVSVDQAHEAKAFSQLRALAEVLPEDLRRFLRKTIGD